MLIGEFKLIQQTQYTQATPKYNFPHPIDTLQIPQRLLELSLRSLKKTQDSQLLRQEYAADEPLATNNERTFPSKVTPEKLKPNPAKTPIVAIDVSSIKLGETQTGTLLAVRGAVVWKQTSHYNYVRLGPFPFHVTERNQDEICSLLQNPDKTLCVRENAFSNIPLVQTKLTTLLELWIREYVNQTTHDYLTLWDGSLVAGTPETPTRAVERLLKDARLRQNTVLAFSKMTRMLFRGHRITDLVLEQKSPCLLKIGGCPTVAGPLHLLGNVFVAKLSPSSCAFRLDVDKELSYERVVDAVQRLLGNDMVSQSYPEALRLAHIYSTFTANEVLGIQRCVARESNLKIVERPNIRRLLFDRFGKGPEG
jgi:hypothetical protein